MHLRPLGFSKILAVISGLRAAAVGEALRLKRPSTVTNERLICIFVPLTAHWEKPLLLPR